MSNIYKFQTQHTFSTFDILAAAKVPQQQYHWGIRINPQGVFNGAIDLSRNMSQFATNEQYHQQQWQEQQLWERNGNLCISSRKNIAKETAVALALLTTKYPRFWRQLHQELCLLSFHPTMKLHRDRLQYTDEEDFT